MTSGAGHAAEHTHCGSKLSEIEVSHKAGKRQWVISEKVLLRSCFSGPASPPHTPTPREPAAPLHKNVRLVSWPPSYPFKLVQSKVQLVYNSTSDLWWGEPCARDEQRHRKSCKISQAGHEAERARVVILQEAERITIFIKLLKIKCWTEEEVTRKKKKKNLWTWE